MAWIIDGHNLIGALPDIDLAEPQDESLLLTRLRYYRSRVSGQTLIVFFDSGTLPGSGPDVSRPGLQVRFALPGQTADDAIIEFLKTRAQPGQYAVVTNDHELTGRARMAGASVIPASVFAQRLERPPRPMAVPEPTGPDPHDPAYGDIYTEFLVADRLGPQFAAWDAAGVDACLEQLYGDDPEKAQVAAFWLGRHGGDAALPALRDALTHEHAQVRAAALLALGELGNAAALPDMTARLLQDESTLVRTAAAQALGHLGLPAAQDALKQAQDHDAKTRVRKAAAAALAQVRAKR